MTTTQGLAYLDPSVSPMSRQPAAWAGLDTMYVPYSFNMNTGRGDFGAGVGGGGGCEV